MHTYEAGFCNLCDRFFATIVIEYWYDPAEGPSLADDGRDHPGSPDEIDVHRVVVTSLTGETWEKTREELEEGGWAAQIDAEAFEYVEVLIDDWLFDHLISNAEPE